MAIHRIDIDSMDFSDIVEPGGKLPPVHPGEILREEFLAPLEMSANALAKALHVPTKRIAAILNEDRGITADTALRLARYFGGRAEFWMNLEKNYELQLAARENLPRIRREVEPRAEG